MKKMFKKVLLFATALSMATALTACSGGSKSETSKSAKEESSLAADQSESLAGSKETEGSSAQDATTPKQGGEIVVGIPQDLDSLDPHKAQAAGTREVLFNIFEGLVKPDSTGNYVPAVASDYKISDDAKTYTFTLRDGVKFHDGSDVTVEDVIYSINRCKDDSNGEALVPEYSNIDKIESTDNKTIVITLKEANTEFLPYLDKAIIPASNKDPEKNVIGTGPFKYVSRSAQENVVVERFDDYWGDKAYLDKVTFKIESDTDSIVMDLNGGSIDMYCRISDDQSSQISKDDFNIEEGTMNLVQALYLNNAEKPFNNVKVRQALSYAINRQEIMDYMAGGKGTAIGSAMFPTFSKYYVEDLANVYTQNVEKAKELLKEAGYPDGFEMTITVPSNYQPHIDTAQVLVEQLKAIGVTAKIQQIEWSSWLSDVYTAKKYQSTVVGFDASTLTASALLARYQSDASNNCFNFSSKKYDETFKKAQAAVDDDEKTKLYKECEKILTEEAASVYIQDMANLVVLRNTYGGYVFYPLYVQDMAKIYKK